MSQIHPILRMGDTRLLRVAQPVAQFNTPQLTALIDDMFATMHSVGGAGLAAPQIGVNLRLVIFGFDKLQRYPDAPPVPPTVLINPEIIPLGDQKEGGWEGCLSVPGLRGWVDRVAQLRYGGFDATGKRFERTVDGFHARVVQHECDHLDGILYPMRVTDFTRFGFTDVLFPDGFAGADD
jgi:peptide deformylase